MSARYIFDTAPLGSLVRHSDGQPKPPAHFTKKLAAWQRRNATGRLIKKDPARTIGNHIMPASITLHEGDYASGGVVVLVVTRTHSLNSELTFEIVQRPSVGLVRILHHWGNSSELLHLASSFADAERWLLKHPYNGARLEEVLADEAGTLTFAP